jgi:predicted nucleic acid-binding protein
MEVYLFDTNIWSKWFRKETFVTEKIAKLDKTSKIFLSSIVWGEVIYGAKANELFDIQSYSDFILNRSEPEIWNIDKHVAGAYGELRAKLFEKLPPKSKKQKRPEQLIDPVTATEIEIDENDLWIVAQAITHKLTLVTNDKMRKIFSVTPKELKYEIWR